MSNHPRDVIAAWEGARDPWPWLPRQRRGETEAEWDRRTIGARRARADEDDGGPLLAARAGVHPAPPPAFTGPILGTDEWLAAELARRPGITPVEEADLRRMCAGIQQMRAAGRLP